MGEFRFKPEQLAVLRDPSMSLDDRTSPSAPFLLTDEQFSSLLGAIPAAPSSIHAEETKPSPDTHGQVSSLTAQLLVVRQKLSSNMKGQIETVQKVSTSILQRDQLGDAAQRFDRNTTDRRDRIDQRIQLVHTLQRQIEEERLKRMFSFEREMS